MGYYRLFDRVVDSHLSLRLLPPTDPSPGAITVRVSEEPVSVPDSPTFVTWHSAPDGYLVDLALARAVVAVDRTGHHLVVHPGTRAVDLADYGLPSVPAGLVGTPRLIADALVTNVFCTLPELWGEVPLHAACLETGAGVVLLCARTGFGKTTLAQALAQTGWQILDDDTNLARVVGDDVEVIPMGARSRVRKDAARLLNLRGEPLPGYADGKQAMTATPSTAARRGIRATFHLVQLPEDAEGAATLRISPVAPGQALVSLTRSMFSVDRRNAEAMGRRMATASALANVPAYSVLYRRHAVSPMSIAAGVRERVQSHVPTSLEGARPANPLAGQTAD